MKHCGVVCSPTAVQRSLIPLYYLCTLVLVSRILSVYINNVYHFTAGSDYVALRLSITFAANEDRVCFNVTILDDRLSEGVENFVARISSVPSGVDIGNPDTAVISIMDDESKKCRLLCDEIIIF